MQAEECLAEADRSRGAKLDFQETHPAKTSVALTKVRVSLAAGNASKTPSSSKDTETKPKSSLVSWAYPVGRALHGPPGSTL
jgi:hypothetical protein